MSEPSRWARTVVWDMFEKLELPKDTLLISAWAKEIDEAARKHGMVYAPNCPSCAEKDKTIRRLLYREFSLQDRANSRLCPNHNGKWEGGRCVLCELEAKDAEVARRIRSGWSIEKAITEPPRWKGLRCIKNPRSPIEVCDHAHHTESRGNDEEDR